MDIDYTKTVLLEVDIQNDFCPAYKGKNGREHPPGALAVTGGDEVIGTLNSLAERVRRKGGKVLATQDWHPAGHVSFASSHPGKQQGDIIIVPVSEKAVEIFMKQYPQLKDPIPAAMQQVLWPDHCVQNTEGAAFHESLDTTLISFVFRKGYHKNIDSYSAFFENDRCTPTDLYGYLKQQGIETILIGGLATDYCVYYSVTDSIRLGFTTYCVHDACAGIDLPTGSLKRAVASMKDRGALFAPAADF
ncbi:MAG: nicotinamidase [Spirochaetaceae bacterium]|jgi:nicotinamidase/pyrazinamidase|nr:nicotinamidase [Spirochaetaceae bacterium]